MRSIRKPAEVSRLDPLEAVLRPAHNCSVARLVPYEGFQSGEKLTIQFSSSLAIPLVS